MLNSVLRNRIEEIKMRLNRVEDRKLIDDLVNLASNLNEEVRRLREKSIEDSWRNSPDRSGGQFSDQEILDSYRKRW